MIGVDEVGRGCWAGPLLVVAAKKVSGLPGGLKDSKLLSKAQRQILLKELTNCCRFGEGWVDAADIDDLGLANALKLGVDRALRKLDAGLNEEIIMDGKTDYVPKRFINSTVLVNADNLVPIVSAASIYAKVTRDNFMSQLAESYPLYLFEKNVGYGTRQHQKALDTHGAIKSVHRFSFSPIAKLGESL